MVIDIVDPDVRALTKEEKKVMCDNEDDRVFKHQHCL